MTINTGPIFFHHIPKTGGTSLVSLLRTSTPPGLAFTEADNTLSKTYTEQLAAAAIPASSVIHGHPGWNACSPFRGKARFVTLLREPRRQLVSHYLHAVRDPSMPQHEAARALGFQGFLRTYLYNIPFQTNALYLSITDPDEERRRALQDPCYGSAFHLERYFAMQLQAVLAFLDEFALVGTLLAKDDFMTCLAALAGWSQIPALPHHNAAAPAQRNETPLLMEQLEELESEPALAPLFAIERATYGRARSLLQSARARLDVCASGDKGGMARRSVHRSSEGEIALGANFELDCTPAAGTGRSRSPERWWTRAAQVSRLHVRFNQQRSCRLIMHADLLVGVTPQEVLLCSAGRWLAVTTSTTADGMVRFSAVIDPSTRTDGEYCELSLYLEWNRYPTHPPHYPALRIAGLALETMALEPGPC